MQGRAKAGALGGRDRTTVPVVQHGLIPPTAPPFVILSNAKDSGGVSAAAADGDRPASKTLQACPVENRNRAAGQCRSWKLIADG
jgi:hypothetical protein